MKIGTPSYPYKKNFPDYQKAEPLTRPLRPRFVSKKKPINKLKGTLIVKEKK